MRFPWWNHWPTSDIPSDGRRAVTADRASHTSVLTGSEWADYKVTPTSRQRVMLHGLTGLTAAGLVPLARSWLSPAAAVDVSPEVREAGYHMLEKAYVFDCSRDAESISVTLEASEGSPVINPAFILAGWAPRRLHVEIGAEVKEEGAACRIGRRHHADSSDLIVWLEHSATAPVRITFSASG